MPNALELVGASVFTVFCIVLARIYSLVNLAYTYWDKRNVNGPKSKYVFGTWKGFANKFVGCDDYNNALKFGKVYGTYDGVTPNLLVTDPKAIKEILDTSAESFQDARSASESSLILKESLQFVSGQVKDELPTPGLVEKAYPKLNSSATALVEQLAKACDEDERVNMTKWVTEFVDDAIATSVFGIELNADIKFKERFVKHCSRLFNVNDSESLMGVKSFLYGNYFKEPWLCPEKTLQYFVNLVIQSIADCTGKSDSDDGENHVVRLLLDAAKADRASKATPEDPDLTVKDGEIISRCIALVLTMANATRTTVLMGLYALAKNEKVQEELYKELEEYKTETPSYMDFEKCTYLDRVVKEVLRLYPFEYRLEKLTSQPVRVGEVELDKDVRVSIPLYALHRSADYYEEPETFDPDRFSTDNTDRFTYLPYGQAGLNGSHFSTQVGLLASKVALFNLVKRFKFTQLEEKTLNTLFKTGITRVPRPQQIDISVTSRELDAECVVLEDNQ